MTLTDKRLHDLETLVDVLIAKVDNIEAQLAEARDKAEKDTRHKGFQGCQDCGTPTRVPKALSVPALCEWCAQKRCPNDRV